MEFTVPKFGDSLLHVDLSEGVAGALRAHTTDVYSATVHQDVLLREN